MPCGKPCQKPHSLSAQCSAQEVVSAPLAACATLTASRFWSTAMSAVVAPAAAAAVVPTQPLEEEEVIDLTNEPFEPVERSAKRGRVSNDLLDGQAAIGDMEEARAVIKTLVRQINAATEVHNEAKETIAAHADVVDAKVEACDALFTAQREKEATAYNVKENVLKATEANAKVKESLGDFKSLLPILYSVATLECCLNNANVSMGHLSEGLNVQRAIVAQAMEKVAACVDRLVAVEEAVILEREAKKVYERALIDFAAAKDICERFFPYHEHCVKECRRVLTRVERAVESIASTAGITATNLDYVDLPQSDAN